MNNVFVYTKIKKDITRQDFDCGDDEINQFAYDGYYSGLIKLAYTYGITYNGNILGYIMVTIKTIHLSAFPEEFQERTVENISSEIATLHIKFIAIKKDLQKHKIGTNAFKGFISFIKSQHDIFPVRAITLDSKDCLVSWYESLGFDKMQRNTCNQDGVTTLMCLDTITDYSAIEKYEEEKYGYI